MTRRSSRRARRSFSLLVAVMLLVPAGIAAGHDDDHDHDDDHGEGDDPGRGLLDSPVLRGLAPPPGFVSHVWAAVPSPTNLEWGPDGRLYVLSLTGQVYTFDPLPDGQSRQVGLPGVYATDVGSAAGAGVPFYTFPGLATTNGLAVDPDQPGTIYVSEWYSEGDRTWGRVLAVSDTSGDGLGDTREVMLDGLPGGQHWVNDMVVNPIDGKLYITNGNRTDNGIDCSSGSCAPETDRPDYPWRAGGLLRIDRSARSLTPGDEGVEVVAEGMRNLYDVAFWPPDPSVAFIPINGPQDPAGDDVLYATNVHDGVVDDMGFPSCLISPHGRGELVEELVDEVLGLLTGDGGSHDHGESLEPVDNPNRAVIDRFGACDAADVLWPIASFGGHGSANGLAFAHGSNFPGTYGNDLFVTLWGSLELSSPVAGHKLIRINLLDDGTVATDEDGRPWVQEFATGGLPLDVTFGPDGAMYVADQAGVIQRIAWAEGVVPPNDEWFDGHEHDHGNGHDPVCEPDCPEEGHDHDFDYRTVDRDTYATPDHPSYGYQVGEPRHHDVRFRRLWGCDVDHPYFAWLVDTIDDFITETTPDIRSALLNGFLPMSPVPNDFGYPETYWHWWRHVLDGPATHPDRSDPDSWGYRDEIVQPHNWIEYLLMVPEHVAYPHRERLSWVVEGVMFAIPHDGPGPNLYGAIPGVQEHPCNPFHDHGGIDNPHFHIWPRHHIHPLAMNPAHLCTGEAEMKDSPWPLRDTWHCVYDGDRNDPDIGHHDPDNPWRDGDHDHGGGHDH